MTLLKYCPTCGKSDCNLSRCEVLTPYTAYAKGRMGSGWVGIDKAWYLRKQGYEIEWPQSPVWDVMFALGITNWTPVRDKGD